MGMKQKKNQNGRLKKTEIPILNFFDFFPGIGLLVSMYGKLIQRASMWLNLYGHQALRRKLTKGLKTQKRHFDSKFPNVGQPDNQIS